MKGTGCLPLRGSLWYIDSSKGGRMGVGVCGVKDEQSGYTRSTESLSREIQPV